MSKSIKLKDNTYWDTKSITHNRRILYDLLNKYIVNSDNYVVTPSVNYDVSYDGGNYKQQMVSISTPWSNYTSMDKVRYFKLRVMYIQNSNYTEPWRDVVVGRQQGGDSWSKRLWFNSARVTSNGNYSIYEEIIKYEKTDGINSFLNFIWERRTCGSNIKYIEFYEVLPLFEN